MNASANPPKAAATRLGRAVRATTEMAGVIPAGHRESHRQTNWLRDVILGGQDGLVNIRGIILGVIGGGGSNSVLLATGFAAAITESISMGAVGYTSLRLGARLLLGPARARGCRDRLNAGRRASGGPRNLLGQGL